MSQKQNVVIPDLGGAGGVTVIELFVKPGDSVAVDDPIILLEGDKATMEVPSPVAGVVEGLAVKEGDSVNAGDPMMRVTVNSDGVKSESTGEEPTTEAKSEASSPLPEQDTEPGQSSKGAEPSDHSQTDVAASVPVSAPQSASDADSVYAGPAVRRLAHVLEVNLSEVRGSGRKGRILASDVYQFVQSRYRSSGGAVAPTPPVVDFSQFGSIETQPLNKIKQMTGRHLTMSWQTVPHVTQFHQADITDLEAFRQENKQKIAEQGGRLTPLVFIMKAMVDSLRAFPQFNASLDLDRQQLILKKYYHIGIAVDTPQGLVVPVIRDVDQKDMQALSKELVEVSEKARAGQLSLKAMQGGCTTISSLGGLGVGPFTPVVNVPEVAILGVGKAEMKPVYRDHHFEPRLMLPLCLSYDHRVIDGAEGARFMMHLASRLTDIRTLLL